MTGMINVNWWHDAEWDRYNAKVVDLPAANATGRSEQEMRELLVTAHNRETNGERSEEEFTFTQVSPPTPPAEEVV